MVTLWWSRLIAVVVVVIYSMNALILIMVLKLIRQKWQIVASWFGQFCGLHFWKRQYWLFSFILVLILDFIFYFSLFYIFWHFIWCCISYLLSVWLEVQICCLARMYRNCSGVARTKCWFPNIKMLYDSCLWWCSLLVCGVLFLCSFYPRDAMLARSLR